MSKSPTLPCGETSACRKYSIITKSKITKIFHLVDAGLMIITVTFWFEASISKGTLLATASMARFSGVLLRRSLCENERSLANWFWANKKKKMVLTFNLVSSTSAPVASSLLDLPLVRPIIFIGPLFERLDRLLGELSSLLLLLLRRIKSILFLSFSDTILPNAVQIAVAVAVVGVWKSRFRADVERRNGRRRIRWRALLLHLATSTGEESLSQINVLSHFYKKKDWKLEKKIEWNILTLQENGIFSQAVGVVGIDRQSLKEKKERKKEFKSNEKQKIGQNLQIILLCFVVFSHIVEKSSIFSKSLEIKINNKQLFFFFLWKPVCPPCWQQRSVDKTNPLSSERANLSSGVSEDCLAAKSPFPFRDKL